MYAIRSYYDQASDVVVPERMASREHGRIEHRAGKFVLIDHSANGTYEDEYDFATNLVGDVYAGDTLWSTNIELNVSNDAWS